MDKGPLSSSSSPTFFNSCLFENSHPNRCSVISHGGFIFNLSIIYLLIMFYLVSLPGMWDLSSLTRDWTCAPLQWKYRVLTPGPPGKSFMVILICISLINEVDYLLAIRLSSLEKTVYFPSVHLKNRVIWLFAIELYWVLYIFWILTPYQIYSVNLKQKMPSYFSAKLVYLGAIENCKLGHTAVANLMQIL